MSNTTKKYSKLLKTNSLFPALLALCTLFFLSCNKEKTTKYTLDGIAQGSYYHIVYLANEGQNRGVKEEITTLLTQIDNSLSLWKEGSLINKINQNQDPILDSLFIDCLNWSQKISHLTGGYLDCTIGLLVEKHGFAAKKQEPLNQEIIDSLLQYVGYKTISIEDGKLRKTYPQTKIDLNAIAQGYTTDKVSWLLKSKGITNFIVDIGGGTGKRHQRKGGKLALWHRTACPKQPFRALLQDLFEAKRRGNRNLRKLSQVLPRLAWQSLFSRN